MISRRILIIGLLIPLLTGCGAKKHLTADRWQAESRSTSSTGSMGAIPASSDAFDGHLKLLYEKKIKGAADTPIWTGRGLVAFRTTRQRFLAYDQDSGDLVMQIKKRRGYVLNPVITDTLLVLIQRSIYGHIQVRNLFTGKVIQGRVINEIRSGPIIVSNRLIFGSTKGLLSLTLPELETDWRTETEYTVDVSAQSDSDHIYFAANGFLKAVGAGDGEEIWSRDCGSTVVSELSLGTFLYAALADGRMMAIDKDNGQTVWEHRFEFPVYGGATECDKRLYFGGTDGNVYCLSSTDGSKIWEYRTDGIVTARPVVYGRTVLIGSHDRHFYSLDRSNGELIDRRRLEGAITLAAAVDRHRIFVTCRSHRLYCFEG